MRLGLGPVCLASALPGLLGPLGLGWAGLGSCGKEVKSFFGFVYSDCGLEDAFFWWELCYLVTHLTSECWPPALQPPLAMKDLSQGGPPGSLDSSMVQAEAWGPWAVGSSILMTLFWSNFPSEFSKTCKLV